MTEETTNQVESPFQRLQRELGELINGAKPGDRLPTEPELAKQLRVSRSTLREAMRSFETQGLLIRKQGSGTYRADATGVFETGLEVLDSLETLAARLGLDVSMGELLVEQIPADEDLAKNVECRKGISFGECFTSNYGKESTSSFPARYPAFGCDRFQRPGRRIYRFSPGSAHPSGRPDA